MTPKAPAERRIPKRHNDSIFPSVQFPETAALRRNLHCNARHSHTRGNNCNNTFNVWILLQSRDLPNDRHWFGRRKGGKRHCCFLTACKPSISRKNTKFLCLKSSSKRFEDKIAHQLHSPSISVRQPQILKTQKSYPHKTKSLKT